MTTGRLSSRIRIAINDAPRLTAGGAGPLPRINQKEFYLQCRACESQNFYQHSPDGDRLKCHRCGVVSSIKKAVEIKKLAQGW